MIFRDLFRDCQGFFCRFHCVLQLFQVFVFSPLCVSVVVSVFLHAFVICIYCIFRDFQGFVQGFSGICFRDFQGFSAVFIVFYSCFRFLCCPRVGSRFVFARILRFPAGSPPPLNPLLIDVKGHSFQ